MASRVLLDAIGVALDKLSKANALVVYAADVERWTRNIWLGMCIHQAEQFIPHSEFTSPSNPNPIQIPLKKYRDFVLVAQFYHLQTQRQKLKERRLLISLLESLSQEDPTHPYILRFRL